MRTSHPTRAPLLTAVCATLLLGTVGPGRDRLAAPLTDPLGWARRTPTESAVSDLCALLAWLCVAAVAAAAALVLLAHADSALGRIADVVAARLLPAALRRLLETSLGLAVVVGSLGPAAPALAQPATPTSSASAAAGSSAGPYDRPAGPAAADTPLSAEDTTPEVGAPATAAEESNEAGSLPGGPVRAEVVVAPGDSLWAIAADVLGPTANDAAIDREWRRWWAANRAVVGIDPDLIHPGQRLQPPGAR